jgi:signal transduction histidine kinase
MSDASTFDVRVLLEGARIVAARVDESLIVREVVGDWCDVPIGEDVRDAIPALIGMEDELSQELPYIQMPFVSLGASHETPVAISVQRDWKTQELWILLRDVSEEAAVQERLVHQHNALSLAHRELAAARDAALMADQAKTRFLANVSHELRTPLNVVIGGASILRKRRETPLPTEDVVAFSSDIHDSGILLLQLVDDLIDLSRAETGNLTIHEEWCLPSAIIDEMIRLARGLAEAEGVEIIYQPNGQPPEIYADPRRVKQILLNLLSNAVKVCEAGSRITVETSVAEDGDFLMTVRDNGPGMSDADLVIALEPFGQPNAETRSRGTGLGLAIVARLADLHQAKFTIETELGAGLAATTQFPAARVAANTNQMSLN